MGVAIPGVTGLLHQPTGQVIDGSLKFDSSKKNYLTRTPGTAGSSRIFTFSTWTKGLGNGTFFCNGVAGSGDNGLYIMITNDSFYVGTWTTSWQWYVDTNRLFRDDGWYHLVVSVDTTISSPSSDRVKLYVNGVQETSFSNAGYPSQDYDTLINNTAAHAIGRQGELDSHYIDKKLSQVYWIDGQQLGPEYFGFTDPLTNTWRPKKYTGGFNNYTLTAPTYNSGQGSDVTTTEFAKMVDGDLSTYGQGNGASGTNRFIGFSLPAAAYPSINVKIKNTTGSALDFIVQPSVTGQGLISGGNFASNNNNNGTVNVPANTTLEDTFSFPSGYEGFGRIYLNNSGNAADAWEIYDFGGTKVTTNSFYLPMDGNSSIGQDKSGNGNDFTPSNFGGSVELDNPIVSGALPILNTLQGGSQAGIGVRTDTSATSVNAGQTWSSGSTVTGGTILNAGQGFDGSISSSGYCDLAATDTSTTANVTFTASIPNVTRVEVFVHSASSSGDTRGTCLDTDGVTHTSATLTGASQSYHTIYEGPPITLANVGWGVNQNGQTGTSSDGFRAFRVNGYVLQDSTSSGEGLVLALPLVGDKEDVSNQINGGSTAKVVAANGNATSSSEASNLYADSFKLDGSGDYITVTDSTELEPGTGDFCYEGWFRGANFTGAAYILFDSTQGTGVYFYTTSRKLYLYLGSGQVASTNCLVNDKWHHIAFVRDGETGKIFCDGVLVGSGSKTDSVAGGNLVIGASTGGGNPLNGYVQDVRVYNGTPKYFGTTVGTQYFVPPSRSPDILPDTPSGVAGGSKLTKITDGAVHFDGTNDKLIISAHSDLDLSSGDFTVEGFVYPLRSQEQGFVNNWNTLSTGQFQVQMSSSGTLQASWAPYSTAVYAVTGTTPIRLNAWSHFAYTRSGSTFELFLDGISQGTRTSSNNASVNSDFILGENSDGNRDLQGYLSNVRVIKGTALYTSRFTPPTAPLTNVTNTKLLCCTSPTNVRLSPVGPNVGITTTTRFNSNFESIPTTVNGLTVTNNGSVTTTSAGTNSYGFTNCADLDGSNSLSVDLGTIPALTTIDLVFKVTGTSDNKYVFGIGGNGLVRRSSSSFDWYNGSDTDITTSEIADGNWHHLRVTPTRLYFDNTLIENNTSLQFINNNTTADGDNSGHMALGAFRNGSGTIQYNGAIDFGLVRVMPGVDLGAPSSYPITTNGTLSDTETIPNDGIIVARGNSAATNFNPFNTDINTVRGQETGYPTWNPLRVSGQTLSNSNMTTTGASGNVLGSMFTPTSGKFYWEVTAGSNYTMTGIQRENNYDMSYPGNSTGQIALYLNSGMGSGQLYEAGSITSSWGGGVTDDIIGVALDMDNNKVYFYNNGRGLGAGGFTGTPEAVDVPTGGGYTANCRSGSGAYDGPSTINFGQNPFKFPPPDGFQPLNAVNVRPETVIARPDQFVGVTTYTGTGDAVSPRTVELPFAADLVWAKSRDRTSYHMLVDTVRGNNKVISSNDTDLERDPTSYFSGGGVASIDGKIISIESGSSNNSNLNTNNEDAVVWSWKAGGSKNTFNVDDVGYVSASDVGMNVGGQNSNYYDSSQTWSNFLSSPQGAYNNSPTTNAFNGDLSSKFESGNPVNSHSTIRFEPSTPIRVNKGIRIYAFDYSDGQVSYQYRVNDASSFTTITYSSGGSPYHRWVDLNFVGDLSSFEYRSNTSITYKPSLLAVEIDGRQLLDSGVTPTDNYPTIPATGCSVGTKQGFSITKYTGNDQIGASIPHGLLETPKFVVIKNTTNAYGWATLHTDVGFTGSYISGSPEYYMLYLNGYAGRDNWSQDTIWDPTPSYVRIDASGGANWVNNSNSSYIMYAWHDVPGLQKFGTYLGNENTSGLGPFVELGFRPAIIWIKNAIQGTSAADWVIYDSERNKFNPSGKQLYPNRNIAEADDSNHQFDILSNGFRVRSTSTSDLTNATDTYIYCAWAEVPTFNLYGGQANAR